MHMHMLLGAVLHATVVAVIGFFVLFAAGKASGIVRLVGTILGWWLWIIAVGVIVCALVCPTMGGKGMPWMEHMGAHDGAAPADTTAAPAKPDTPAPAPAPAPKKP